MDEKKRLINSTIVTNYYIHNKPIIHISTNRSYATKYKSLVFSIPFAILCIIECHVHYFSNRLLLNVIDLCVVRSALCSMQCGLYITPLLADGTPHVIRHHHGQLESSLPPADGSIPSGESADLNPSSSLSI